jgi:hypothetical protein
VHALLNGKERQGLITRDQRRSVYESTWLVSRLTVHVVFASGHPLLPDDSVLRSDPAAACAAPHHLVVERTYSEERRLAQSVALCFCEAVEYEREVTLAQSLP